MFDLTQVSVFLQYGSCFPKRCRVWVPSWEVDFMSKHTLIACPHKFCATTTRVWTANPRFYGSVDASDSLLVACRVPYLLSSPKHPYYLGTKYPNLWAWGSHSHSNLHRPFHCLVWQREMHLFCRAEPFNGIPGISSCFLSFGSLISCQYHERSICFQYGFV